MFLKKLGAGSGGLSGDTVVEAKHKLHANLMAEIESRGNMNADGASSMRGLPENVRATYHNHMEALVLQMNKHEEQLDDVEAIVRKVSNTYYSPLFNSCYDTAACRLKIVSVTWRA